MSTIISTVLIATPPAFLLGWILSKVLFRHISLTRPNALVPASATPLASINAAVVSDKGAANTEQTAADVRKLNMLRQKLAGALANGQSLQSEIQLLKEAAAEREHKVIELKRKLQVRLQLPEESLAAAPARQQQFVQMMKDRQATLELRIEELKHELAAADTKAKRTAHRFNDWRQKIKAMAKQSRQQRAMINELREELRQRDIEQRKQAARPADVVPQSVPPQLEVASPEATVRLHAVSAEPDTQAARPPYAADTSTAADHGDEEREDLQVLRGVGPALHKRLNEQGIYRLRQLALMSPQELDQLGDSLGMSKKLLAKHEWGTQARLLLNRHELPVGEKVVQQIEACDLRLSREKAGA